MSGEVMEKVLTPNMDAELSRAEREAVIHRNVHSDWFLRNMVQWVNGGDLEIGITLQVGGIQVSGLLVCGSKYFEGFAEEFVNGFGEGESKETIKAQIAKHGNRYKDRAEAESEDDIDFGPGFIHIKDAHYLIPGSVATPQNRGVWWRGRISAVDGFHLGVLTSSKS